MKETINFEDCNNGIYLNIHPEDPDAEDVALVFNNSDKNECVGNLILEDVRNVLDEEDCNRAKITIIIEPIKED